MSVFARHLAPQGIAYLNFNALPGGHLRRLVRDMMQFRLAVFDDPEAHGEDAVRFLRLVTGAQPEGSPYRRILEEELGRIEHNPVGVLFHDDLVPHHQAFHFRHVVEHAAGHGLQYLCEARPADVHPGRYPGPIRAALHRFGGGRIAREQCFDFLVCQMYRCSLFCREGIALAPVGDLDGMRGLRAASPVRPATAPADLTDGIAVTFHAPDGADLHLDDSAAKAALEILAERWPASVGAEMLFRDARKRSDRPPRRTHAAGTARVRRIPRHEPRNGIRRSPHLGAAAGDGGQRSTRCERALAHRDRAHGPNHQPASPPGGDRRPDRRCGACTPRRDQGSRGAS